MKKRHLATVLASLVAVSAMSVSVPRVSADAEKYIGLFTGTNGASGPVGNSNTMTISKDGITRADGVDKDLVSYNATEFKKVLEIEDTANIPAVSFDYKVESGTPVSAGEGTLAVLAGLNPKDIAYKLENVSGDKFVTTSNSDYNKENLTEGDNGFTLKFSQQNLVPASGTIDGFVADATQAGDNSTKSVDDNVLINNVNIGDGKSGVDTYYAIKTVQMDFSGCGFTEPGIYRYYITESGANQGVNNDYSVTGDDNCKRTIDVYVEDATYTRTQGDVSTTVNALKISGYVMYQGHVTTGPKEGQGTTSDAELMEDGLAHTNPSGNGGKNGLEVVGAVKSEGIRNIYITNDITFGKTVTGNQASKDKFFKFTIKLDDDASSEAPIQIKNVGDDDIFAVTGDWEKTVAAASDDMATPNAATLYTAAVISNASNTSVAETAGESDHGNNVIWLTGTQLKAGYSFYLQNNDYISIHGLPENIGYTLVEAQEDYVPTASLLNGELTNDITHNRTVTGTFDGNGTFTAKNTGGFAQVIDTKIQNDVDIQLTNTREGFIPTGVILSVAAPSAVGLLAIGGVIYLAVKRRKDEDEE